MIEKVCNNSDQVVNDILLEHAIEEVGKELTVFVPYSAEGCYFQYVLSLFETTFDMACAKNKSMLKIHVVPERLGFVGWKSLLFEPSVQAVFGETSCYDPSLHAERTALATTIADITYHPLGHLVERKYRPSFLYFDDPAMKVLPKYDKVRSTRVFCSEVSSRRAGVGCAGRNV